MQIVCPNCATNYQIESSALGAAGRLVRCVRCRYVWFARDPEALASIAQAHRSDVQALAASIAAAAHGDQPLGTAPYDPSPGEATPPFDDENPYPLSDEPLEIADAPTLAPTDQDTAAPAVAAPAEDLKTGIARRVMRRAGRTFGWWLPGLPVAILALLARCRFDRLARGRGQGGAADRIALCGDRPAGQSARADIRRRHDRYRDPRGRSRAGGRRHDRECVAAHRRGAEAALLGSQPQRSGSLCLDRGAEPQRAGSGRIAVVPLAAR